MTKVSLHLFLFLTEVANGKPYNESVDVYSFAILFWEMIALESPFKMYTMKSLRERVWNKLHKRPPVDKSWPVSIQLLLKRAWNQNIEERHSMKNIESILRKECIRCRDGNETGLEHSRRRSTFVFRTKSKRAAAMGRANPQMAMEESHTTVMTM